MYAIEEDHIDKNLIFCGTEYGAFFSPNQGQRWKELSVGLPTIAVRDIAIQERESDLVLGTFGRGFYVLDDYSALRSIENSKPSESAVLYSVREALSWERSSPLGLPGKAFQGDNFYTSENLGPEAIFTYYYSNTFKSLKDKRTDKEKKLIKDRKSTPYPNYNELKAERDEEKPQLVFTIKNSSGTVVKKEFKDPKEGVQRFHWDLRYTLPNPIDLSSSSFYNPWEPIDEGTLVEPGTYTIQMGVFDNGSMTSLVGPKSFSVKALNNTVMPAEDRAAKVSFQKSVAQLEADYAATQTIIRETNNKLRYIKSAIKRSEQPYETLSALVIDIENKLQAIGIDLYGDSVKRSLDISQPQTPANRIGIISYEQKYSTSAPTETHKSSFAIAKRQISAIKKRVEAVYNVDIKQLEQRLIDSGAAYTPGRGYKN